MKHLFISIIFLLLILFLSVFTFEKTIDDIKNYFYMQINKTLKEHNLDFVSARLKGDGFKSSSVVELKGKVFDKEKKEIAENLVRKVDVAIFIDNKIKVVKKPIFERIAKNMLSDILEYPVDEVKSDDVQQSNGNNSKQKESIYLPMECSKKIAILLFENQINFKSNGVEFTEQSYKTLDNLVKIIKKCKNLKFDINGYTDNVGDRMKNLLLSGRRAEAVKNYLVKKGSFDAKRFRPIGFGSQDPIADNKTVEGRAKNRRIEILVVEE